MSKIKLPEVPGDLEYEGKWAPTEGKQSRMMLHATLGSIQMYEDEIISELGEDLTVTLLPTNRVLISNGRAGPQVVAYMSDPHADARLILDDYVPELAESEPE